MKNLYITSDKVGEFIQRMYEMGIKAEANPSRDEVCITMPQGGYEWVKILSKNSFEEVCEQFNQKKEASHE